MGKHSLSIARRHQEQTRGLGDQRCYVVPIYFTLLYEYQNQQLHMYPP